MTKKLNRFSGLFVLVMSIVIILVGLFATTAIASPIMVVDDQGSDDEPGQKDLNFLTVDYAPNTGDIEVTWGWDDTKWSGKNTGDACTLFDTDDDGFANYSLCITVNQSGGYQSTRLYTCGADNRADRCSGPTLQTTFHSNGTASKLQVDPFEFTQRSNNDCSEGGATGCLIIDTVATLTVDINDFGGGVASLINVCSYPSQEPNSDPSDCVITPNSGFLTIFKVANPDNLVTTFTFNASIASQSGDSSWDIVDSGSQQLISYPPGTFDLSEAIPADWNLDSASCSIEGNGGTGTFDSADDPDTITGVEIRTGLVTTCTFNNNKQAYITVTKVVNNDHGGTALPDDFDLTLEGVAVTSGVPVAVDPGTYTAGETLLDGYTFDGYSGACDGNSEITVAYGDSKTCTLTNSDQTATLTVKKVVINDNGGSKTFDNFSFSVNGGSAIAFETDGQNDFPVDAGTYTVTEPSVSGYTTTYNNCSNLVIPIGGNATCTITNDDQPATLIVKKIVINDNGGSKTAGDFSFSIDDGAAINFDEDGQNDMTVDAGTYTVNEPAVSGYTTTYDNCSDITIPNGGSATCTITNDDQQAYITVNKVIVNDNGGNASASDFNLTLEGDAVTSGVAVPVNPGTYTAGETQLSGYTFTGFSGGCDANGDVTVALGESKTCTLTNDDVVPTLTLIKNVINDNGGNAQPNDFALTIDGTAASSGVAYPLLANTGYAIDETQQTGYTFVNITGDRECPAVLGGTVTLDEGENVTCTITNDDVAPKLTIVKNVINNDGGDALPDDFDPTVGGIVVLSSVKNTYSSNTTYAINETQLTGYSFVSIIGDAKCPAVLGGPVILAEGDDITCTITNDDVAPTLKLVKIVTNDNGGDNAADNWTLYATTSDEGFTGRNVSNLGGSGTFRSVYANHGYVLSESTIAGYNAGSWSCDGGTLDGSTITLAEGDTGITCSITNDDVAPQLSLVKNVINDDGGNNQANEWTLTATGDGGFTGTGTCADGTCLSATKGPQAVKGNIAYTLSESSLSGYTPSTWSCVINDGEPVEGNTVTLSEGQSAVCSITNDDIAPTLKLVKSVTNDNGGNNVPDDWTLYAVTAIPFADRNFENLGGSGEFSDVYANQGYVLSESTLPGYSSGNWSCSGGTLDGSTVTLAEGQNVTCTIINNDVAPQLTLIKYVINDDGGNAVVSEFPLFINTTQVTSGVANTLLANTLYTASETNQVGYTPSQWGGDCSADGSITLNEGDNMTCTITNDDVAPTLKLVKIVTNDNGGNAVANDWTLSAVAAAPYDTRNFNNLGGSGDFHTVYANQGYVLSESSLPGYTTGSWRCDGGALVGSTITLAEGATGVTCSITNDDIAPKLALVKDVITDNGGTADPDDFALTIGANAALSGVAYTLSANTAYAINETQMTGYTFVSITGDAKCPAVLGGTVTLDEGNDITCTITNNDQPGSITITKRDDAGAALAGATFTLWIDTDPEDEDTAHNPLTDTITDYVCMTNADGTCTISAVNVDDYWVVETPPEGYTAAADQKAPVTEGALVELTFTNTRLFKIIVLVCKESDNSLYASTVDLNGVTKTTLITPPVGITAAQLCALTGATYGGLPANVVLSNNYSLTVHIPR